VDCCPFAILLVADKGAIDALDRLHFPFLNCAPSCYKTDEAQSGEQHGIGFGFWDACSNGVGYLRFDGELFVKQWN
jgi:hypothetical protein